MFDLPYLLFRGGSGFALIVVGIGFLLDRSRNPAKRALGVLFPSVGLLFCISATDPLWPLSEEVGNLVVIALVYAVSQALFELTLYLFGDARVVRQKRLVYWVGAVLSLAVWALPLLDYALGWRTGSVSVEDGQALGPLHTFLGPVIYGWPLAVTVLSIQMGRWHLRDVSLEFPGIRVLIVGLALVMTILAILLAAVAFQSQALYRVGHTGLELLMLAWYFHLNRAPDHFSRLRDDVEQRHATNQRRESTEWEALSQRLEKIVEDDDFLRQPRLTLTDMAEKIGVPAYLLSRFFNQRLNTPFPAWLNVQRISWVCRKMAANPDAKILDLAFEAGFNSKSTFNLQFSKILGMSPTEYRASQFPEFQK